MTKLQAEPAPIARHGTARAFAQASQASGDEARYSSRGRE
jgi:hypothetical protein